MKFIKWFLTLATVFTIHSLFGQGFAYIEDSTGMPNVELNDVIIKASKDHSRLKELPTSISIVTGREIEINEINSLAGFDGLVPNLYMPDYGTKLTTPIYIRGIGSRINSPAVGMYVDNVPFFEKSSHNIDLFDIQNIEVLRGPQGTLYGRNSRGGIINITTLSPMDYQGTKVQLSGGNYGFLQANASHYGKGGNNFAYSLSANYKHTDGFFTNVFNNEQVDKMDSYSLRNRLIWNITDRLTAENIASYENSTENGYPYAIYDSNKDSVSEINYDHPSLYDRKLFSNALIFNYKTENYELTSTTAFQYLDDVQEIDQDFTPTYLVNVSQDQILNQLSQEFVAQSDGVSGTKWLLGLSGFYQNSDKSVAADYSETAAAMFRLPPGYSSYKHYLNVIQGGALFGQVKVSDIYDPNLSVTLGLRIDGETESLDYLNDYTVNGNVVHATDTLYPSMSSLEFLPKIALNYRINNANLYATITRGHKTGGFNSTFEDPKDLTFKPEYSTNYEMGIKTSVLKKQLYIDAALFYIDMTDQQIYQTVPSGRGSMLTNAGESVSKGGEIILKAIPYCGFETSVNYGYTYATFTEHIKNENENYNGNFIPYAPRHTFSLNIHKTIPFHENALLDLIRLNLLYRGAGETYWKEDNLVKQEYYDVIDAKVSFVKGKFQLDFFGKNLTNSQYNSFYFTALGNEYVQTSKPLFAGAKVSVKF